MFGDPQITGKPAIDDVREGKRTLLMAVAESRADNAQKDILRRSLGNPELTDADLEAVRSVLTDTRADQAIEARIGELTSDAMEIVHALPVDAVTRQALTTLIKKCVWRQA